MMEKISRILPPSRRVVAVETEASQPVRPGAPEFGRPSKRMEIQDRVSLSPMARERANAPSEAKPDTGTYRNAKESAQAKVVEDLAEKFFNPRAIAKEGEGTRSEEVLKSVEANKIFSPELPSARPAEPDDTGLR